MGARRQRHRLRHELSFRTVNTSLEDRPSPGLGSRGRRTRTPPPQRGAGPAAWLDRGWGWAVSERFAGIVTRSLRREFSTKDGPARVAVNDLNLRIEPGDLVAMLGPNGAGKTTTVRMLTGLLRPTSGSATINGYDVASEHRRAAHGCGWSLGGELGLYPRLTATQNLTFFGLMYGMRGRALRN